MRRSLAIQVIILVDYDGFEDIMQHNPILDVVIFIRNLFHLGNFEKTEEPAESPITTKISALLNDNRSTGKIIRHISKDRTLNRMY